MLASGHVSKPRSAPACVPTLLAHARVYSRQRRSFLARRLCNDGYFCSADSRGSADGGIGISGARAVREKCCGHARVECDRVQRDRLDGVLASVLYVSVFDDVVVHEVDGCGALGDSPGRIVSVVMQVWVGRQYAVAIRRQEKKFRSPGPSLARQ